MCTCVTLPVAPHDLIANRNAGLSNMLPVLCGASSSTAPLAPSRPHSRKTCVSMRGRVVVYRRIPSCGSVVSLKRCDTAG